MARFSSRGGWPRRLRASRTERLPLNRGARNRVSSTREFIAVTPIDDAILVGLNHRRATDAATRWRPPFPGQYNTSMLSRHKPRPEAARFIDNFDRADGELGSNWRSLTNAGSPFPLPVILDGQATMTGTSCAAIWRPNKFVSFGSQLAEISIHGGDGNFQADILLRSDGTYDNCYLGSWIVSGGSGFYRIGKIVNGAFTQLAIAPGAALTGALRLTFEDVGGVQNLYVNGSLVTTSGDLVLGANQYVGFYAAFNSGTIAPAIDVFYAESFAETIPDLAYDHPFTRAGEYRRPTLGLQPWNDSLRGRYSLPAYFLVAAAQTIIIPPGDLTFAGVAPAITATGTATIAIPPGTITFAGVEPIVTVGLDPLLYVDINRRRWALAAAGRRGPPWQRPSRTRVAQPLLLAEPQTIIIPPGDLVFAGVEPVVTVGVDPALIADQNRRRSALAVAVRRAPARLWPRPRRLDTNLVAFAQTILVPTGDLTFTGVEPTVSVGTDPSLIVDQNRRRSTLAVAARRLPARLWPRPRRLDTNLIAFAQTIVVPTGLLTFVNDPLYGDDFNRADTTPVDTAGAGLGAGWTSTRFFITNNRATRGTGGNDFALFLTDLGIFDHFVEAQIVGTPGVQNPVYNSLHARSSAIIEQNAVLAYIDPLDFSAHIGALQGGSFSDLGGTAGPFDISGTYILRLEVQGTTARLYHNGRLAHTQSIAALTNLGTFAGLNANGATPYDNFVAGPLVPIRVAGTGTTSIAVPPGTLSFEGVAPSVATDLDPSLIVDQNRRRSTLAVAARRVPARARARERRLDVNLIAFPQTITIPPGDLVLTGVEPVVTTNIDPTLVVDQNRRRSTLAVAGRRVAARVWPRAPRTNVPLIAFPQTIVIPPGDLTLTGVEPVVTAGMDIALIYDQNRRRSTLSRAVRRVVASRPQVRRSSTIPGEAQTIIIPPAELTFTGVAPTVTGTSTATIAVPPAAATFTGVAPVVTATGTRTIPVPAGPVTFAGVAPTITATGTATILAPAGVLTLTGIAPFVSSTGGFNIQVPTGTLTATGVAPAITATGSATILTPTGVITFDGVAPTATTGMDPALSVDINRRRSTLAVATRRLPVRARARERRLDPNLIAFPQTIVVPPAALTVTGIAPAVTATGTATILAPTGAVSFAGVAPTVAGTGAATIVTPVGLVTFDGVAPNIFAGDDPVYLIDAGSAYRQAVNTAVRREPDRSAPWKWMLRKRRSDRQGALLPSAVEAGFPLVPNVSGKEQLQVRLVAARRVVSTAAQRTMAQHFHQAPPPPEPQTIIVPPAALTFTGVAPTVAGSATTTILAPTATVTVTGIAPAITATGTRTIAVPPAALTFAGIAPTVRGSSTATILTPTGALTLTGVAPTVSASISITIPPAALTLTGRAPTVAATGTRTILVPAGQLAITGVAPFVSSTGGFNIQIPTGTLTLTGVAPTVTLPVAVTITIPTGTVTLTGRAPTVAATGTRTIPVPAAALTLTGVAPDVTGGTPTIIVPPAALALSGVAPIITATGSSSLLVPTGQVTIVGVAPSLAGTGVATDIAVPSGVLVLVGVAPGVLFRGTVSLEALAPTCSLEVLVPNVDLAVYVVTVTLTLSED